MNRDHVERIIEQELAEARRRILAALFSGNAQTAEQLSAELDALTAKLDAALAQGGDKYQIGIEIHGRCRRAKRSLDGLTEGGDTVQVVREKLRTLTERLLREVFELDDVRVNPLTEDQIQEAIGEMFDKLEAHLADQPEQGDEPEEKE